MKNIKYAVIILNYNTATDALAAVESVITSAKKNDEYIVCVVDGGSSKIGEKEILESYKNPYYRFLILDKNIGYARGNNAGVKYIKKEFAPEYIVIMNPDVLIREQGVISDLISDIVMNPNAVGGQPLVNNVRMRLDPLKQINIRKVPTYYDCIIESSVCLKRIFKKKYERTIYKKQMPYTKKILYEVPSGAFFIIETDIFEKIGYFSEKTFLYQEENILGSRVKNIGKSFIFNPTHMVEHYQGNSTGSHRKSVSEFSFKCNVDSMLVYAEECLGVSKFKRMLLKMIMVSDYYLKKWILYKL